MKTDLATLDELCREFGLPRTTMDNRVKRFGLKPLATRPAPTGLGRRLHLYSRARVAATFANYRPPPIRKPLPAVCRPKPAVEPAPATADERADLAAFWAWHAELMKEAGIPAGRKPYFEGRQ